MTEGRPYGEALFEAQRRGIAEADPSLDVAGWDTACKLVILANSVLGLYATLDDVTVQGITDVTRARLQAEIVQGRTVKLLATAEMKADEYVLSVTPVAVPTNSFLGQCAGWEMGVEIHSDLYGRMYHKIWEREPLPTAAAMLRDAVNLTRARLRPAG
jgi:homoserine dehydrogenase